MSLQADVDDDDSLGGDVATNAGWEEFVAWASGLDSTRELHHLAEHGWADDSTQLTQDLELAINTGGSAAVLDIAENLLRIAKKMTPGAVLTVSDGVIEDDDGIPRGR